MPSTIDRATILEATISDANAELERLRSDQATQQRMKSVGNELRNFRQTVQRSRVQLNSFDEQIDSTIASMRAIANGSASENGFGLVTNDPEQLAEVERLTVSLKNLILSRARHAHQLRSLEDRLAGQERQNLQLPKQYLV